MSSRLLNALCKLMEVLALDSGDSEDLDALLEHIAGDAAQIALDYFGADTSTLLHINPITKEVIGEPVVVGRLLNEERPPRQKGHIGRITEEVLSHEGGLFVEDLAAAPQYQSSFSRAEKVSSFAAISLYLKGRRKHLGAIYLDYRQPRRFSDEERAALRQFGDQVSLVLHNLWLLRRYRLVARIGEEINLNLKDEEALLHKLLKYGSGILDMSNFLMVVTYHPQTRLLDYHMMQEGRFLTAKGKEVSGGVKWVIENRQPLFIPHYRESPKELQKRLIHIAQTRVDDPQSLVFVPLEFRRVILGVLSVQHMQPNVYDQEDVKLLRLLANQVALALSNMRLFNNLISLNEAGQELTQQLDSSHLLESVIACIKRITLADQVILYPYEQKSGRFAQSSRSDGGDAQPAPFERDLAALTRSLEKAKFWPERAQLHAALGIDGGQNDPGAWRGCESTAAAPLRVGEEFLGSLFLNFYHRQRFDAPQKQLVVGLANYAAIAIKNSEEHGELAKLRVKELELLQEIDSEITRAQDLKQILHTILRLAMKYTRADDASILLYNRNSKVLEEKAVDGRRVTSPRRHVLPLHEERGISWWVFNHKQAKRLNDVRGDPEFRGLFIEAATDIHSELDVPLLEDDEVVGIINLESVRPGAFSDEHEKFIKTLAGQTVLAVKHAQAYEREKRIASELLAIQEVEGAIVGQKNEETILKSILEKALDITRSPAGQIVVYDPQRDTLYTRAARGVAPGVGQFPLPRGNGIVWRAFEEKRLLNVSTVEPEWRDVYEEMVPSSYWELAVPMLDNGEARGVINVEAPKENPFTEADERLLKALANLAVIALQTADRYKKLEEGQVRLNTLHEVGQEIVRQIDDMEQVMQAIVRKALVLTGVERGGLYLYNREGNSSDAYLCGLDEQGRPGPVSHKDFGAPADGEELPPLVIQSATAMQACVSAPDRRRAAVSAEGAAAGSMAAVPLSSGRELLAVLALSSVRPNAFDPTLLRVVELFAGQATIAIKNARNFRESERRRERFRLLYEASEKLSQVTETPLRDKDYRIVTSRADVRKESQVVVRRLDPNRGDLVLMDVVRKRESAPFERMALDEGLNGWVAKKRKTLFVPDVNNLDPGVKAMLSYSDTHSLVVAPIQFRDRYYGNLALSHEQVNYFKDADIELIEGLAQQLAITIYRLEVDQAERNARALSYLGAQNVHLEHKLGNDLGWVPTFVRRIQEELTKHGWVSRRIETNLNKIEQDVQKVLKLSRDLKQKVAGINTVIGEDGGTATAESPAPVALLLEAAAESVQGDVKARRLNIQVVTEIGDNGATARAASQDVQNILYNLTTNAVEAMPNGGTLTLRSRDAHPYVELEVEDTGVGIPVEVQHRIFTVGESSGKDGTGIGLPISLLLAEKNSGVITFKSQVGKGSVFTLRLPKLSEVSGG